MSTEDEYEEKRHDLLTGKELADMFRISLPTLYRTLKRGPAKGKNRGHDIDLRMLPDTRIGGKRFWKRSAAERLLREEG
jgi:hypothetical protein